ncbi:hypothetical protein BB558_007253 [Smittium angustum]|uniref:Uncharacterized protein n=1 Tax=Smittium angustum TaxID=133377 RepID=A0A2U1IVT0_SMIAN|nr:hypothetical protein BB558_007253 [Smittium angustum]
MSLVSVSVTGLSNQIPPKDEEILQKIASSKQLETPNQYSQILDLPTSVFQFFTDLINKNSKFENNSFQFLNPQDVDLNILCLIHKALLNRINEKISISTDSDSQEDLIAKWRLEKIKLEQTIHEAETQTSVFKFKFEKASTENNELLNKIDENQKKINGLENEKSNLITKNNKKLLENQKLVNEITTLKSEKNELLNQVAENRSKLDIANEEIYRLNTQEKNIKTKLLEYEQQMDRLSSIQNVNDVREHLHKQSLEILQKQVDSLNTELEGTQFELQKVKKSLSKDKLFSNRQIETLSEELKLSKAQLANSQTDLEATRNKLTSVNQTNSQLNQDLIHQETQFTTEMKAQKKLTEAWENTANDAKKRLFELETSITALEESLEEQRHQSISSLEYSEKQIYEWQQKCEGLENKVETLENQLKSFRMIMADRTSGGSLLSPSTSIEANSLSGKISLPELWAENIDMKDMLEQEREERVKLQTTLNEILQELEERGPILAAERESFKLEKEELLSALSNQHDLEEEIQELQHTISQRNVLIAEKDKEIKSISQEMKDLSKQVCKLLRVIEELKHGEFSVSDETRRELDSEENLNSFGETNRVITEQLVTFNDVQELQLQNQRLLKTVRELASRVEAEEEERRKEWENMESEAVKAAQDTIEQLALKIKSLQSRISILETEKDMLSSNIKHNETGFSANNTENTSALNSSNPFDNNQQNSTNETTVQGNKDTKIQEENDTLRKHFQAYQDESRSSLNELQSELEISRQKYSEARITLAQVQAQNELLQQQLVQVNQDYSSRGRELQHLMNSNNKLLSQIEKYETQLESLTDINSKSKVENDSLRRELTIVLAEQNVLKKSETQWHVDMTRWQRERESLTTILQNTTHMRDEWKELSEKRVLDIESKLDASNESVLREKRNAEKWENLWRAVDNQKQAIVNDFETKLKDSQDQLQQIQVNLQNRIEELDKLKSEISVSNNRNNELEQELKNLKNKIEAENNEARSLVDTDVPTSVQSMLKNKLLEHKAELEKSYEKTKTWEQRAATFKEMAVNMENSLGSIQNAYNEYKQKTSKQIEDLEKMTEELKSSETSKINELKEVNESLNSIKTKLENLEKEKADLENSTTQNEQNYQKQISILKVELEKQKEIANEKQELYEKELVSHAKDVESMLLSRTKINELTKQLNTQQDSMNNLVQENCNKISELNSEKKQLESRLEYLEKRANLLEGQNEVLITTLETASIKSSIVGNQNEMVVSDPATSEEVSDKSQLASVSSIGEVVSFQRRERDVAIARAETLNLEAQRWKQLAEKTQKALDESRLELASYQEENSNSEGSILAKSQNMDVKQKLHEAVLLRESNEMLRQQLTTTKANLENLENEISNLKSKDIELQNKFVLVSSELEERKNEIVLLEEANNRWQKRHEQVLAKYERIDPQEHEQLQISVKNFENKCIELESKVTEYQKLFEEQKNSNQLIINKALESAKSRYELEAQKLKLSSTLEQQRSLKQVEALRQSTNELQQKTLQMQKQIEISTLRNKELDSQIQSKEVRIVELSNELEEAKQSIAKQIEETIELQNSMKAKTAKTETWKNRFDQLRKQSMEKLAARSETIRELREMIKELTGNYPGETPENTPGNPNSSGEQTGNGNETNENQNDKPTTNRAEDVLMDSTKDESSGDTFSMTYEQLKVEFLQVKAELDRVKIEFNNVVEQKNKLEVAVQTDNSKSELASTTLLESNGLSNPEITEPSNQNMAGMDIDSKEEMLNKIGILEQQLVSANNELSSAKEISNQYEQLQTECADLASKCNELELKLSESEKMKKDVIEKLERVSTLSETEETLKKQIETIDRDVQTEVVSVDEDKEMIQELESGEVANESKTAIDGEKSVDYEKMESIMKQNDQLNKTAESLKQQLENLRTVFNKSKETWNEEKQQFVSTIDQSQDLYEKLKTRALTYIKKASELSAQVETLQKELEQAKKRCLELEEGNKMEQNLDLSTTESGTGSGPKSITLLEAEKMASEAAEKALGEAQIKYNLELASSIEKAKKEVEIRNKLQVSMSERKATLYANRISQLESLLKQSKAGTDGSLPEKSTVSKVEVGDNSAIDSTKNNVEKKEQPVKSNLEELKKKFMMAQQAGNNKQLTKEEDKGTLSLKRPLSQTSPDSSKSEPEQNKKIMRSPKQ